MVVLLPLRLGGESAPRDVAAGPARRDRRLAISGLPVRRSDAARPRRQLPRVPGRAAGFGRPPAGPGAGPASSLARAGPTARWVCDQRDLPPRLPVFHHRSRRRMGLALRAAPDVLPAATTGEPCGVLALPLSSDP